MSRSLAPFARGPQQVRAIKAIVIILTAPLWLLGVSVCGSVPHATR